MFVKKVAIRNIIIYNYSENDFSEIIMEDPNHSKTENSKD